jgi:L-amino acid N-acyltransferase YncA
MLVMREPREADWPAILGLANRSVAGVPGAGSRDAWAESRRRFDRSAGIQRQLVAVDESTGEVVGYGALERRSGDPPDGYRLFVVTAPEQLGRIGELLYRNLVALLRELGARSAWFAEHAADRAFLEFARTRGFREKERRKLEDGAEQAVLSLSL